MSKVQASPKEKKTTASRFCGAGPEGLKIYRVAASVGILEVKAV